MLAVLQTPEKKLYLILSLLVSPQRLHEQQPDDENYCDLDKSYWEKIPNHRLVGSSRVAAASPEECQRLCEEDLTCRSVNYYESSPECGINTKAWGDESAISLELKIYWDTMERVDYYHYCARPGRFL